MKSCENLQFSVDWNVNETPRFGTFESHLSLDCDNSELIKFIKRKSTTRANLEKLSENLHKVSIEAA